MSTRESPKCNETAYRLHCIPDGPKTERHIAVRKWEQLRPVQSPSVQASFGTADKGLYIHTFPAFCDTLFDVNNKAGEAPATSTKNTNDDNNHQRQNRIAEPFIFCISFFVQAENWRIHAFLLFLDVFPSDYDPRPWGSATF